MKSKKISLEIYPYDLYFFLVERGQGVIDFAKRRKWTIPKREMEELTELGKDGKPINGAVTGPMHDETGRPSYFIWLPYKPKNNTDLAMLGHESLHVTTYVFEEIGVPGIPFEYDEVQTYFMEYVLRHALDFYRGK